MAALPILVVGDVQGDVERLRDALSPYPEDEVQTVFLGDFFQGGVPGAGGGAAAARVARSRRNSRAVLGNHDLFLLVVLERSRGVREVGDWRTRDGLSVEELWLSRRGDWADLREVAAEAELETWLRSLPFMIRLDDGTLMQHTDDDRYAELGNTVDAVNDVVHRWTHAPGGVLTALRYTVGRHAFDDPQRLQRYLQHFDARRVVHGHTPHWSETPETSHGGRLIGYDGRFSRYWSPLPDEFGADRRHGRAASRAAAMSAAASSHDAVVVGAGPNGLIAAITLARAGVSTLLLERASAPGGACRSAELTLPGFIHDVGPAVHLFALVAPALRQIDFARHGTTFVHGRHPLAHPLDGGDAALLQRSVDATAATMGGDGRAYARLMKEQTGRLDALLDQFLGPPLRLRHPVAAALFARDGLQPVTLLAHRFREQAARALVAGIGAHSVLPLSAPASSAIALILGAIAHTAGWPVVRGGSQRLTDALVAEARSAGVQIVTDCEVTSLRELPPARCRVLDVTPRQLLAMDDGSLPPRYRRALSRFRYAPGAFKLDWALDAPIPWAAAECGSAPTVHVGGTLEMIADSERTVARGGHAERPFLLLVQPTIADPSRAPAGKHVAWAYCHVPNGSTVDMTERMEAQVERFAPGFRERILARAVHAPADLERMNPNCVGGDVGGGLQDLRQTLIRPAARYDPYATPVRGLFLCSASTPPGGGVHGMCGLHAARSALRHLRRSR